MVLEPNLGTSGHAGYARVRPKSLDDGIEHRLGPG
jgi:hypothetical protein